MEEDLDSKNLIPLDIEKPSQLNNLDFIRNKRLFSKKDYANIFTEKNSFKSSRLEKCYFNYKKSDIVFPLFFFLVFYLLLITVILSKSTIPIILLPIIYILAQIIQGGILPYPIYHSRANFFNKINRILNADSKITLKRYSAPFDFKGKYTFDVTGKLNIPNTINLIKIGEVQYFIRKEYYEQNQKYKLTYYAEINYEGKSTYDNTIIYNLNSENNLPPFSAITFILSIFLLQWINALIFHFIPIGDIVIIYPAKLLTEDLNNNYIPESNIVIHGETLDIKKYVKNNINENEYDLMIKRFEREESERKKKEKEERERKRELEENTHTLSYFSDNNYEIEVYREYETVFARVNVDYIKNGKLCHFYQNLYLGDYDKNIEKKEEKKQGQTYWIINPKGFDIEIHIIKEPNQVTITIGKKFHRTFRIK